MKFNWMVGKSVTKNMNLGIGMLPRASFIPFKVAKLNSYQTYWLAGGMSPGDLDRHAYCNKIEFERATHEVYDESRKRTFLADRYGGSGISTNGGGARCGYSRGVQIKGIGPNGLVGVSAHDGYKSGGLTFADGVREVIWSHVSGIALPYGGVKPLALLGTGTEIISNAKNGTYERRVILLRETEIRPAHFMRASIFRPSEKISKCHATDFFRTELCVRLLENRVRSSVGCDGSYSIQELFERAAAQAGEQLGASFAKRIMHGALSPSNVSVSGAWIDFGTASSTSDYGRIVTTRKWPDMWLQHAPVVDSINELGLYFSKYCVNEKINSDLIVQTFLLAYQCSLQSEMMMLFGFPKDFTKMIPEETCKEMFSVMKSIFSEGNQEPFSLFDGELMPDIMGRYHLPTLLRSTGMATDNDDLRFRVESMIGRGSLANRFIQITSSLRDRFFRQYGDSKLTKLKLALNCARKNFNFKDLQYQHVTDSCEKIFEKKHLDQYVQMISEKAKVAFLEAEENCGPNFNNIVEYLLGKGVVNNFSIGKEFNFDILENIFFLTQDDSRGIEILCR